MNIIETVLGWLLNSATFFDNLKTRRGDDPGIARYRRLMRACVGSTLLPFGVLVLDFLFTNLLDAVGNAARSPGVFDEVRATLADAFLGLFLLSSLIGVYNYWRLLRFQRGHPDFA